MSDSLVNDATDCFDRYIEMISVRKTGIPAAETDCAIAVRQRLKFASLIAEAEFGSATTQQAVLAVFAALNAAALSAEK
ncbi:hypothetical protein DU000_03260 [Parvibium lacunae]|uniref:Uncharacterized protein n=1 Tax=Parvibium lacunae TaxID=1888893 RepID=A0A368L8A0_9BURK|nr:hypothetical protein DU000_03260 [Parvibium lacunae]